jgi:hypothetical protein
MNMGSPTLARGSLNPGRRCDTLGRLGFTLSRGALTPRVIHWVRHLGVVSLLND